MAEPTLHEWRVALAIAASGSFRATARSLDVSPSTLSHLITGLEHKIGRRLFHRTTRSVAATVDGEEMLARIAPLVAALDAAVASDGAETVVGPLRINASLSAASYLIAAVIPGFLSGHPGIELDLRHEERLVDVIAQGCDAGIRLGRTVPGDMIGISFGPPLRFVTVASPAYLAEHGIPRHPLDLLDHRCIRTRLPSGERYAWEFVRDGEAVSIDGPGVLSLDRQALIVEAASAGLGIGFVLEQAIPDRLKSGALAPLLIDWCPADERYMLYYSGRRHVPPPLRAFIDYIRAMPA